MTTTGQNSMEPPVSTATVAAWRRRQQICLEAPSPLEDEERANGFDARD